MISCLMFRSFIHFELIFVYNKRVQFHFFLHVNIQFSQCQLWKRLFLSILSFWCLSKFNFLCWLEFISGFSTVFH